jgi:hypothetical protein
VTRIADSKFLAAFCALVVESKIELTPEQRGMFMLGIMTDLYVPAGDHTLGPFRQVEGGNVGPA